MLSIRLINSVTPLAVCSFKMEIQEDRTALLFSVSWSFFFFFSRKASFLIGNYNSMFNQDRQALLDVNRNQPDC